MSIEIRKPDLVQRVTAHIRTGRYHDADELLEKALDRWMKKPPRRRPPIRIKPKRRR